MRVILVEPDKVARIAEIGEELHDMQEIVGGPIQALYPWDDSVAIICNDERKLKRLPLNRVLKNYDIIAGTFFVCGLQGEKFSSLTEQQLRKYQRKFRCPEKFIPTSNGLRCLKIEPVVTPKEKNKKSSNYER